MDRKPYWPAQVLGTLLLLMLLADATTPAAQPSSDPVAPISAVPCDVVSVHDGDTVTATAHLPFGVDLRERSWRAFDYDCWELTYTRKTVTITPEEIVKGKAARDDLRTLLAAPGAKFFLEDPGEAGGQTYDRTVAKFWVRSPDGSWIYLATWMEARGHLRTARGQ
jgi:endonuclease YncB( thermonuclease family)